MFNSFRKNNKAKQPEVIFDSPGFTVLSHAPPEKTIEEIVHESLLNSPSGVVDVEELNQISKEHSDQLYKAQQDIIASFDPTEVIILSSLPVPLSVPETYFLKHISKQPVKGPYVQGYWYYEYGIQFAKTVEKLISHRYLEVSDQITDLTFLHTEDLKQILRDNTLPISGKKADLSQRIIQHVAPEDIKSAIGSLSLFYSLTTLGESAVESLPYKTIEEYTRNTV